MRRGLPPSPDPIPPLRGGRGAKMRCGVRKVPSRHKQRAVGEGI
ncbi:MAG: hypothetical protein ACOYLB_09485 [Phototrophicaceae bacterium]